MFARMFKPITENEYLQRFAQHVKHNRATYGLMAGGFAKILLDNYWVFTGLPLGKDSNDFDKFLYLLAQTAALETMAYVTGNRLDHPVEPTPQYQQLK